MSAPLPMDWYFAMVASSVVFIAIGFVVGYAFGWHAGRRERAA